MALQRFQRLAELLQRFGVLFLLAAGRPGLQMDLMSEGRELGQQRMEVDRRSRLSLGKSLLPLGDLLQPGPKIAQDRLDPLRRQGFRTVASSVFNDTRRRLLRHVTSSM